MKKSFKLSESELDVMLALWECNKPIRPSALLTMLQPTHDWSISTLQTLLARLYDKQAVDYYTEKRFRYFYPTVTKSDYALVETESLIQQLDESSPVSLMAGLLGNATLNEGEIGEIEALLEKAKNDLKD